MSKQIIDEITGIIRIYSDGSIERPLNILNTPVSASQAFVNGVATRDLKINPQTGIWARIYLPETSPDMSQVEKYPILLHFHGGGFCIGSADWRCLNLFLSRLVKQCRVMCVSVDYRLAPEHRLPAACEDGMESLEWLHRLARGDSEDPWLSAHGDFTRCILLGESAGGNLVHEVAIRAATMERLHPLRLRGGIMIHPGFVREQRSRSEMETPPDIAMLSTETVDKLFSLALPEGSTKDHPIINPMGPFAPNLQHLNLPPFLVAIADHDLIRDTQFEYCEAMKIAGKSVEVVISNNVGHCFHVYDDLVATDANFSQQAHDLLDAIRTFITTCCQDTSKY